MAQRMQMQGEARPVSVGWQEPEAYAQQEDVGDCDPVNPGPLDIVIKTADAPPGPGETISIRASISPSIDELLERVTRFNQEIIGLPPRDRPGTLSRARTEFRAAHLREEIDEFERASAEGDVEEAADGLIDLIYVALGALYEMGVNYGPAFDEVHAANMRRRRGQKANRPDAQGYDAVKPEGWVGPDNSWILRATPEVVELGRVAAERGIDADLLRDLSEVFLHVARIRQGKGRDYNTSVELHDYFAPWGHQSYHQLMHMKALRARSIVELMGRGMVPNYEGLLDTLYDSLNYTCFWAEAIREGRLPITGARGAEANGAVQTT